MKFMKIIGGFIFALFVTLLLIGIFTDGTDGTKLTGEPNTESTQAEIEPVKIAEPEEPTYLWQYNTSVDEMDGKTRLFTSLTSDNELSFAFPYNGGSVGTIIIRNMEGKNSVLIKIEKGQFMSNFNDSEYIRIKFDDDVLEKYNYSTAADGSSNLIFPSQSSKLISKIKKSKTIKIEAPFYNEGRQVLNFTTEGLEWDYK